MTAAVASEDAKSLYTAGKEGSIVKWDLRTGKKLVTAHKQRSVKGKQKANPDGHTDEIWTLALSSDGKYLASGGKDRVVGVWDVENTEGISWVKGFTGHRDSISVRVPTSGLDRSANFLQCLAFRKSSQQLFSGSYDRTVKLFDLSVMGYVETLFGHQDFVMSIDSLRGETAVTCGGRDRTVRYWKVIDETQLVFRGGGQSKLRDLLEGGAFEGMDVDGGEKPREKEQKTYVEGSMEVVCMIDETTFLSGGDSGCAFYLFLRPPSPLSHHRSISLWSTQKKKPVYVQALAHGLHETVSEERGTITSPRWITAIGSLRYSDLFASGRSTTGCAGPSSPQLSRFVGRPAQVVETGPKIEIILVGWVRERSGRHQFDPAPVCAERRKLLVGGNEEGFGVACCWGWTGDQDGAVDCHQGIR